MRFEFAELTEVDLLKGLARYSMIRFYLIAYTLFQYQQLVHKKALSNVTNFSNLTNLSRQFSYINMK